MKHLFTLVLILFIAGHAAGQSATEETQVKACLENYMSGEGNRMEQAFHTSAFMKYIDPKTGTFKDVPIAEFIARIKSTPPAGGRKIELLSFDISGTAAQAKIRLENDKAIFLDYLNLLKIDGSWKIVSKIFSRTDK